MKNAASLDLLYIIVQGLIELSPIVQKICRHIDNFYAYIIRKFKFTEVELVYLNKRFRKELTNLIRYPLLLVGKTPAFTERTSSTE